MKPSVNFYHTTYLQYILHYLPIYITLPSQVDVRDESETNRINHNKIIQNSFFNKT